MEDICFIDSNAAEKSNLDAIFKSLKTTKKGLKSSDADSRLKKCESKKKIIFHFD